MRAGAAALGLAWAAAGRPAAVEVSPRGGARRLRETSVTDPSVPGRVRTSAVAVGANLSGCAFVGEVNVGASMDMDVVSDALNHGALAAEAYRRLADEANRPPRCGVYVNGSAGLGRYAVAAHVYDAVDGEGAYYGDAPLRLAPRDLTVDGAALWRPERCAASDWTREVIAWRLATRSWVGSSSSKTVGFVSRQKSSVGFVWRRHHLVSCRYRTGRVGRRRSTLMESAIT